MSNETNTTVETVASGEAPYGFKKNGEPRGKPGRPAGSKVVRASEHPLIRTESCPFGVKKDGTPMKRRGRPAGAKSGVRKARIEAAKAGVVPVAAPYGFRKSDGMPAKKRGRPSRADKLRAQFLSRQVFPTAAVAEVANLATPNETGESASIAQNLPEGQAGRAAEILGKALEALAPAENAGNVVFPTHSPLLDAIPGGIPEDDVERFLAMFADSSNAYRMLAPPNPSPKEELVVGARVEVITDYGLCRSIRRGKITRVSEAFAAIDCDDVGHQYHALGALRVVED